MKLLKRSIDGRVGRDVLKKRRQKPPAETKRSVCINDIVKQVGEKVKYCLAAYLAKTVGCISLNFRLCVSKHK